MIDYERLYRALIRRLVEIADNNEPDQLRSRTYDIVVRSHEQTIKLYPNDRGIGDDSLQDSSG